MTRGTRHSRLQRPRSFWSAPRITTSGQVQCDCGSDRLCKHNKMRPEPIKLVRLVSEHKPDGKSVNRGFPVLEPARGHDFWCWSKGGGLLGQQWEREWPLTDQIFWACAEAPEVCDPRIFDLRALPLAQDPRWSVCGREWDSRTSRKIWQTWLAKKYKTNTLHMLRKSASRGGNSWCWLKGEWPLGTRMGYLFPCLVSFSSCYSLSCKLGRLQIRQALEQKKLNERFWSENGNDHGSTPIKRPGKRGFRCDWNSNVNLKNWRQFFVLLSGYWSRISS